MTNADFNTTYPSRRSTGGWDLRGKSPVEKIMALSIPEPNSGCWLWLAGINTGGYGSINLNGTRMSASRAAWTAFKGKIPVKMYVCHHCDNRLCVNPDHLFLGTHADNQLDKRQKGRNVLAPPQLGEENPRSKLTAAQVTAIRQSSLWPSDLARQYSVSPSLISMILSRKLWRHI